MLLALRFICSVEWPTGIDGRYYWEHCAWMDRDDWITNGQMALRNLSNMALIYTSQVRFHSARWYLPNTTTVHFQQFYGPTQNGGLPPAENHTLLIAARWRMRGADGSYTYHLHRTPIGEEDLQGDGWSADGLVRQQTRMNTFIFQDNYRTKTGALITTGEMATLPVGWQLRHGTKRRRSRFWLP